MANDKKADLLVKNEQSALEAINVDTNEEEIPEDEYRKAKKKRKNKIIAGLVCVAIVEASVAGAFSYVINTHHIQKRVIREYEYQKNGFVSTTMGNYSGDMDFGLFDGTGEFIFDTGAVYTGEWENDHTNCIFRSKSKGAYQFIEDNKVHTVLRGYTHLDRVVKRDDWKWGDIYNTDANILNWKFDKDKGVIVYE